MLSSVAKSSFLQSLRAALSQLCRSPWRSQIAARAQWNCAHHSWTSPMDGRGNVRNWNIIHKQLPWHITKSKLSTASKNLRKIGELWHFDTLPLGIHLKRLAKKLAAVVAWGNWNFMRWSSPQLHCWASHRSGKNGHPCLAVHGPPGKSFRNEHQRCRNDSNKRIMAAWGLGCASFSGLWTWLVEHRYFLLVDGWPRLLRGEASVEWRSCKWRFLKSAAPKNGSDFPIRKGYFEKKRSRLGSYSKWCDTYHSCNSTRQEWSSLTSDPYHKTHRHPCSRVAFVVPVPSHRFHGAGPWGLGRSSGFRGRNAESRDDKVHQSLFAKAKEYRWMYLEMELCGFELLTYISCTSNYWLISLSHGRWNPCSRTLLKNHTWASRLRSWLHGNTTFHLLKQVQLLNSILRFCVCVWQPSLFLYIPSS